MWLVLYSCMTPRVHGSFQVLPAEPNYVLRSPDAQETPFPEVLSRYSEVGETQGWLLHPNTELHIENAYYREGAPKHGIANFIGTEQAVYQVRPRSLRLISVDSGLEDRPGDQLPIQQLIGPSRLHYRYYRYFFQIVFRQKAGVRGAVLLGANSIEELDRPCRAIDDGPGCGLRGAIAALRGVSGGLHGGPRNGDRGQRRRPQRGVGQPVGQRG